MLDDNRFNILRVSGEIILTLLVVHVIKLLIS